MKLSECNLGLIVEIIDRAGEDFDYPNTNCKDIHYIGHIIGLSDKGHQVIPKLMMASGETRTVHQSNIKPYCD